MDMTEAHSFQYPPCFMRVEPEVNFFPFSASKAGDGLTMASWTERC